MDNDLKDLMQERNNVQQDLKRDRNNIHLRDRYKTLKKQVRKILREAKSQHYSKKLEENRGNTAATWHILRELLPNSDKKASVVHSDDEDTILHKVE